MQNNINDNKNRTEKIMNLRRQIYFLEAGNLHKKVPQPDAEMVEKIIKQIKRLVDNEEVE